MNEKINSSENIFFTTKRDTVDAIEEIIGKSFPVLDHGFIRIVDYMGSDSSIASAARVSYGKGTKTINDDRGLIDYLMRHYHTSPFEMCEIKLHIKMPIFVMRQWVRHRTANLNEYSARYSIVSNDFYVPESKYVNSQSKSNKQSRDEEKESFEDFEKKEIIQKIQQNSDENYNLYEELIDKNVARELARINLSLNFYTEIFWKIDLHNLLNFINLRIKENAQLEIRKYSEILLHDIVKKWTPIAYNAFLNYRLNSVNFSDKSFLIAKRILSGEKIEQEQSGLSKSEWNELKNKLNKYIET